MTVYSDRIKTVVGSAIAVFSTLLLSSVPAFAQLSVSPLFHEEQSEKGRAQSVITLTNVTAEPLRVRMYSEPFTYEPEGFVSLTEDPADLSPYLQFSPREVVIPPMETQRVRALSLFPPSLAEGEYRAVIFAEELTDNTIEQDNVALRVRIGSILYVRKGEILPALSATSAQAQAGGSVVDLLVNNQGAATARSAVLWQLHRSGEVIAQGQGDAQTVIAQGDRIFSVELPPEISMDAASGEAYTLTGELRWVNDTQRYIQPFELPVSVSTQN